MAEQKKEAGSKEKMSLLDAGIGDDFLGSWKKVSVDDTMDFNIEPVTKGGKKKAFNFGNLDMDFNLDGDFGKLTPFKVDMPDFDFSSPDDAKPKKKVDRGSSSGHQKGKLDAFDMSFDFNGFDRFNLDEDVIKGDDKTPATKHTDKNEAAMTGSEHHDPKILIGGGADGSKSSHTEDSAASEKVINQAVKTDVAPKGIGNSFTGGDIKVGAFVEHAAESSSAEIVGVRTEEINQQGSSSDEGMPKDQCVEYALQSTASQSLGGNDSIQDAQSEVPSEGDCLDSRVTMKSDAEHTIGMKSLNENDKQLSKSAPLNTNGQEGKKGMNREIFALSTAEGMKETQPMATGTDSEAMLIGTVSLAKPNDCPIAPDNLKSSSTDLPTENELVNDRGTITKQEGVKVVQSKFFRKSGDVRPPLASSGQRISSFGSSELALKQLNHLGSMKRDFQTGRNSGSPSRSLSSVLRKGAAPALLKPSSDVQTARNTGSRLKSLSSELRKGAPPALLVGTEHVESTTTISFCKEKGVHDTSILTDTRIAPDKVVAKEAAVILRSVSNTKHPDNTSGEGNASSSVDKTPKLNIQRSMKSSLPAIRSIQSSRIVPVNALKSEKLMLPNLSSFKISRNMEINGDQRNVPNKTLKGFSRNIEAQPSAASSKVAHPITHEHMKKSLKRNTEAFDADLEPLNPHKRLSPSLAQMRMFHGKTKGIAGDQVHSAVSEVGKESGSMPRYGFKAPQAVNLEEPKIDRIQMALEYDRKLDELCSMLKKMIEQTKELTVRSIVNNNRLLLLNSPQLDEKIRMAMRYPGKSVEE